MPEINAEIDRIVEALRYAIRIAGFACATERAYVHWNIRFTRFCLTVLKQTPHDAGPPAITPFLDSLELERRIAPATRKQALKAVVFLTRNVFGVANFTPEPVTPAHAGRRPPVVITRDEVCLVISHLEDPWKLAALLMYGSGLRVIECLRLRVRDLDFGRKIITVHDGRGDKRRVVPMPGALASSLLIHLAGAHERHLQDLAGGAGEVHMPESLRREFPNAAREWRWQYVFSSATLGADPRTRRVTRHHLHQDSMSRRFRQAALKSGIAKPISLNLLRRCFATHLLEAGADIRSVQDLMGHKSVGSTMCYLLDMHPPESEPPDPWIPARKPTSHRHPVLKPTKITQSTRQAWCRPL